ncbi:18420_t:CDS:1, partial [Acaulospora morrowiae]
RKPKPPKPSTYLVRKISKLKNLANKWERQDITLETFLDKTKKILNQLSNKQNLTINLPPDIQNKETLQNWKLSLSTHLTNHKQVLKSICNSQYLETIREQTQNKNSYFSTNKKQMIRNLLDDPRRTICLDKIIAHKPDKQVINDPNTIKSTVRAHFKQWTKK